jgi:hypothetical protein
MSFLEQIIDNSLKVPGMKVDRNSFLRDQFSKFYSEKTIEQAIAYNPTHADIPKTAIDRIAKSTINNHVRLGTLASFGAGLPGGFAMVATIPADMAQFYGHVVILAQKLAYLYGWPEFSEENGSEVLKDMLMLFLGVMMGVAQANKVMFEVSRRLAIEVVKRVPRIALTKYAWYNTLKLTLKWVGVKVTKDSFAKGVAKVVPFAGGVVSGAITYITMESMAKNLVKQLKGTDLYNIRDIATGVDPNETFDVEGIDKDFDISVDSELTSSNS